MLDIKSKEILYFLESVCKNGYKVIEIKDILGKVKNIDKEYLKQVLNHLDNVGYISIKYKDKNVYCVSVLPFGRQFIEQESLNNEKNQKIKKIMYNFYIIFFFIAILVAFLGTLIYNLIF